MIDDMVSSASFTLDELLNMGFLDDYDEQIKVRATGETSWTIAREYPFHISEVSSTEDVVLNEDGTITRTNVSDKTKFTIDEFGQVIRRNGVINQVVLSSDTLHFGNSASSQKINVTSNESWRISLESANWVHVTSSSNSLTVKVDTNNSSDSRHDYFRLKSGDVERTVNVYQSGKKSSSDNDEGCIWAILIVIIIFVIIAFLN